MPLDFHQSSAAEEAIDDRDLNALTHALTVKKDNPNTLVHPEFGYTLLHFAVESYAPAVLVLLEHGANPLLADDKGKKPRDWSNEFPIPLSVQTALIRAEHRWRVQEEVEALGAVLPAQAPSLASRSRSRM